MNHKERKVLHLAIITPEKEYDNDAKGVSRLVLHLPTHFPSFDIARPTL